MHNPSSSNPPSPVAASALPGRLIALFLTLSVSAIGSEHYWRHDSSIDRKAKDVRATIVTP